jgi:hypothetical protein
MCTLHDHYHGIPSPVTPVTLTKVTSSDTSMPLRHYAFTPVVSSAHKPALDSYLPDTTPDTRRSAEAQPHRECQRRYQSYHDNLLLPSCPHNSDNTRSHL